MTGERWTAGPAYEAFMGRWSRLVARVFVPWLDASPGATWLDVGCGTGALTQAVVETAAPAEVLGVDPSEGFLAAARARVGDPVAHFRVGSAQSLPLPDAAVDTVVSGLVLNFLPDAAAGVAESVRVVRAGGLVAAYVWDYAEGMGMLRRFWDAEAALDEAGLDPDEGLRFPLCRPEPLRRLWTDAGLADVAVGALEVATVFEDFQDYWEPFLGGQGPAGGHLTSLAPARQQALRELLEARLPTGPDGSIRLTARAWAVRGRRSSRAGVTP
ncbi:MAG: class I SAM-dependent methyltransferase [Dermatophilaceae bacterium]